MYMILPVLSDSLECNAFFVVGRRVALIDPGFHPRRVLDKGREYNITLNCFINTHCHFDHSSWDFALRGLGLELLAHELDSSVLEAGDDKFILGGVFGKRPMPCKVDRRLKEGDIIDLDGCKLEVVHTPGHTPGSICLYEPQTKSLFTGDTLFSDGVGRTDFPGGDVKKLKESVRKLVDLYNTRGVTTIYPGHGPIEKGGVVLNIFEEYFG